MTKEYKLDYCECGALLGSEEHRPSCTHTEANDEVESIDTPQWLVNVIEAMIKTQAMEKASFKDAETRASCERYGFDPDDPKPKSLDEFLDLLIPISAPNSERDDAEKVAEQIVLLESMQINREAATRYNKETVGDDLTHSRAMMEIVYELLITRRMLRFISKAMMHVAIRVNAGEELLDTEKNIICTAAYDVNKLFHQDWYINTGQFNNYSLPVDSVEHQILKKLRHYIITNGTTGDVIRNPEK